MKTKQDYNKLLSTPEWKVKRDEVLKFKGYKCERCGCQTKLQVHHTYYDMDRMPWEYDNESLLVLCKSCHYKEHHMANRGTHSSVTDKNKQSSLSKYIKIPDSIFEIDGRSIVGDRNSLFLSSSSKFSFMCLLYYKDRCGDFKTPTFNFVKDRFGIAHSTYDSCIKNLISAEYISKGIRTIKGFKYLDMRIMYEKINYDEHISIPSFLFDTDIFSLNHKFFILAIIYLLKLNKCDDGLLKLSNRKICGAVNDMGISKSIGHKMLKELSDPSYGFVPILTKHKFGYSINKAALSAIEQRNNERWEEADKYPIYTKPSAFDFTYVEEDGVGKIIKNK